MKIDVRRGWAGKRGSSVAKKYNDDVMIDSSAGGRDDVRHHIKVSTELKLTPIR